MTGNLTYIKNLNKIRTHFSDPSNIILLIFAVTLSVLVLLPLGFLILNTFKIHLGETYLGTYGSHTVKHWANILTKATNNYAINNLWKPLWNSVWMAIIACIFAVVVGGSIAWLVARSTIPFKKFISVVFVFPYIMPSWSIAMFWENMFKTYQTAGSTGSLQSMFGIQSPSWLVYGGIPCAISLGVHYAPFAYILIGGILRNMDSNLEEAATLLKATRWKILSKITLPIVRPALLSTVLLVFASSISSYTVPMFLGVRGDFWTLSLKMKSLLGSGQKVGEGYVLAVVLLLFSVVILLVNQVAIGKRKSFITITGKSSQVTYVNLGKAKWFILIITMFYCTFFAIIPLFSFALESVVKESGNLSTFTWYYWITPDETSEYIQGSVGLLRNGTVWRAFLNSFLMSAVVAFLAGTFGILIGYSVAKKRKTKLSSYVASLSFFPYLIPSMSFGAIYLAVSSQRSFSFLYESLFLLILVGAIKFLPFASKSGTNAMLQVGGEIEEAAIILGVPWFKRMTKILFPIQKSSFISGYLLPFISTMRELSLFVLISSSGLILTAVLANYQTYDMSQMSNGINLIIIVAVLISNLIINKVTGASIDKGIGGN